MKHRLPGIVAVGAAGGGDANAPHYANRIGVNDKRRPAGGVHQNIIGRFGADAVNGQQLPPQGVRIGCEQRLQAATVAVAQVGGKGFQLAGFGVVVARRTDDGRQVVHRPAVDGRPVVNARLPEVSQRLFHIAPGGGLGENGAGDNLKGTVAGPPALGPVGVQQSPVDGQQRHQIRTGRASARAIAVSSTRQR